MVRFPNCKINLGLHILGKRTDGYHNLETVFYPIALCDALEILPYHSPDEQPTVTITGLPVAGNPGNNLCLKAWYLLQKDFPDLPPVQIHLHKVIPMGAGLGGGSADGAFMLMMLNDYFDLNISEEKLAQYALQLGSDCPFFIYNMPCFAAGRGEEIKPVALDLSGYYLYLINPNIHVSTAEAFSGLQYRNHQTSLRDILQSPITGWKQKLVNDFEESIAAKHPELQIIKETLYRAGAVYANMSGSGSTMFGLFEEKPDIISLFSNYFSRIIPIAKHE